LEVKVERECGQPPLVARFGGIPLRWNKWVKISDPLPEPIWSGRSEVIQRLLAQICELCGATENIEVHHIRKLANLSRAGQLPKPDWQKAMATRQRKTLVVCQRCHQAIHYGRYDQGPLSK
jgi:ribosomal protein L40E